jgi:hypothetical protein
MVRHGSETVTWRRRSLIKRTSNPEQRRKGKKELHGKERREVRDQSNSGRQAATRLLLSSRARNRSASSHSAQSHVEA